MDCRMIKHSRTPHLEGSRLQQGGENPFQIPFEEIAGRHLIIEDEIDGVNSAASFDDQGGPPQALSDGWIPREALCSAEAMGPEYPAMRCGMSWDSGTSCMVNGYMSSIRSITIACRITL